MRALQYEPPKQAAIIYSYDKICLEFFSVFRKASNVRM
jgi:hypothetical protein